MTVQTLARKHVLLHYVVTTIATFAAFQAEALWTFADAVAAPFRPGVGVAAGLAFLAMRQHRLFLTGFSVLVGSSLSCLLDKGLSTRAAFVDVVSPTVATVIASGAGLYLLRRNRFIDTTLSIGWFVVCLVASAAGALLALVGYEDADRLSFVWQSLLGTALGLYAITPVGLLTLTLRYQPRSRFSLVEVGATLIALVAATVFAFTTMNPTVYLVLPILLWLCVRAGPRFGTPSAVAVVVYTFVLTSQGYGPFAAAELDVVIQTQLFAVVVVLSASVLVNFEETAELRRVRHLALMNALPDLVVLVDQHGNVVTQNTLPESFGNVAIADIVGEFAPTERSSQDAGHISNDVIPGRVLESRTAPVGDGSHLAVIRDITQLVEQTEALDESQDRWQRIGQAAQEGILEVDADSTITHASQRLCEIIDVSQDDLVGVHLADLIGQERWSDTERSRLRARSGEHTIFEIAVELTDGPRWGLVSASPRMAHDGEYLGSTLFITDITPLKAAEIERIDLVDELADVERSEQARLARDLHDGPLQDLTAVHMILGYLANERSDQEIVGKAASALTDALAALRSGVTALDPVDVASGGLAEALRRHATRSIGVADITIEVDQRTPAPTGPAARVLYRIGREALTNAARHADASRITIRLDGDDDTSALVIEDDGQGFTAGSGSMMGHMGLRSMRERARQAGGKISIASDQGAGTTVSVWIPRAELASESSTG